jgi:hypothetical protein
VPAAQDAVHNQTAVLMDSQAMLVMPAQHIHYVYVLQAEKVDHHAVGRLSAETITAVLIFAAQLVATILLFAEPRVQHTKAGADLTHGIM